MHHFTYGTPGTIKGVAIGVAGVAGATCPGGRMAATLARSLDGVALRGPESPVLAGGC